MSYILKHIKEPNVILYVSYCNRDFVEFSRDIFYAKHFKDRESAIEAIKNMSFFPYDILLEVI